MYYCPDCQKEFEYVKVYFEERGQGYERVHLCPFCDGMNYREKKGIFCSYCGAKVSVPGKKYCCESCKRAGEKMFARQEEMKIHRRTSPLFKAVNEVDEYNRLNGCKLSYGQYYALKGAKML